MAMNYLQYIGSYHQNESQMPELRFLVSGLDILVRRTVVQNLISSAYSKGKTLFIVDNTKSFDLHGGFGQYPVVSVLNGEIGLCKDLFQVSSLSGISRLRTLLSDLGFDGGRAMKIITYLKFVQETERRLGNPIDLSIDVLEQYGGTMLVEWKLKQLVERGHLSEDNFLYLMDRYSEVSAAAADFETFLVLIAPFIGSRNPAPKTAVHIPVAEFAGDEAMQKMLCTLLISYIKQNTDDSTILILDDGDANSFLIDILKGIPSCAGVHMFSNDAFNLGEADRSVLMNAFPVRIFTRHGSMASCEKIENICGQYDVIKHSSSVSIDRRWRANSAWDMLLGNNRTETSIACAPTKESRFRKEFVNSLPEGTGIVDYAGNRVLFSF